MSSLLTVIIPAKNEGGNIQPLLDRLMPVLEAGEAPFEVVFVDDGSDDDTFDRLVAAHRSDARVKALRLSRNFGKEIALAAGLHHAKGAAAILMDADLQHPPELIATFLARWREGYKIVYAERRSRGSETFVRRLLTRAFYRLFEGMSRIKLLRGAGDFCLLDAKVVRALNAMPERHRFGKGLYAWVGFSRCAVPCDIAARHSGESTWSLWKLWQLALDAMTAFGVLPLRVWSYLGFVISLAALGFGAVILFKTLAFGADVPGYPSIVVAISLLAGVQLIGLGVIGEYVGRIFTEVLNRPLFVVEDAVGFDDAAPEPRRVASGGRR